MKQGHDVSYYPPIQNQQNAACCSMYLHMLRTPRDQEHFHQRDAKHQVQPPHADALLQEGRTLWQSGYPVMRRKPERTYD